MGDEEDDPVYKSATDKFHVSKKAIRKFGETTGYAACATIKARGDKPGCIGKHHPNECRQRILREMESDPEYRHQVKQRQEQKAEGAGSARGSIDNVNTNGQTITTKQQRPNTNETTQTTHSKDELVKMHSNVKKAIAYAKERLQETKNELEMEVRGCLDDKLNETMLNMVVKQIQVSEVYSPPRVVEMVNKMGLRGGWSLDLTSQDEDGRPWGISTTLP